jgi:hypothetical protein
MFRKTQTSLSGGRYGCDLLRLCTVLNRPTSRIMLNFILHSPELPSTSSHVKHLLGLASGFSLQVSRQLLINGHHWVPSGSRSYS